MASNTKSFKHVLSDLIQKAMFILLTSVYVLTGSIGMLDTSKSSKSKIHYRYILEQNFETLINEYQEDCPLLLADFRLQNSQNC